MMPGVKALRKILFGTEVTPGTPVATTTTWRGQGSATDALTLNEVEEDIGFLVPVDRTNISALETEIALDDVTATFEQFPYLTEMCVEGIAPVQDGVGTGYVYLYTVNTTVQKSPQTYTLEYGDDEQAEEANFAYGRSLTLSGASKEPVSMSAELHAREGTTTTYSGGATLPVVEDLVFGNCKLYIDDVTAAFGDTQITNSFLGFTLSFNSGFTAVFTGDGQLGYTFVKSVGVGGDLEATLEITFEHDSFSIAEKANWRNEVARLIRLECTGSALATPATETNKRITVDIAGKWQTFPALDDQDGNDVYTAVFKGMYNATAAHFLTFEIVNELTALP